jgi:hypothetical protein
MYPGGTMTDKCFNIAMIGLEKMGRIFELERELGVSLLALERKCHWVELSEEQVAKVRAVEEEMGITLLAYEVE